MPLTSTVLKSSDACECKTLGVVFSVPALMQAVDASSSAAKRVLQKAVSRRAYPQPAFRRASADTHGR